MKGDGITIAFFGVFFLIGLKGGLELAEIIKPKHSLEVVAQNEGTCKNCGAQTIITIRERKGEK